MSGANYCDQCGKRLSCETCTREGKPAPDLNAGMLWFIESSGMVMGTDGRGKNDQMMGLGKKIGKKMAEKAPRGTRFWVARPNGHSEVTCQEFIDFCLRAGLD